MRTLISVLGLILAAGPAFAATYRVVGTDSGPWERIFGAIGMTAAAPEADADVIVVGAMAKVVPATLAQDHFLILERSSPAPEPLGFSPAPETLSVRQITDVHGRDQRIIWQDAAAIGATPIPDSYQVFAKEKWKGTPVLAGKRTGHGAILWMATAPGSTGMERYPYLLQAMVDLGLPLPARATDLWAFFDSSYRIRADVDYLARRWRQSGVSALHVAGWHNVEPDKTQDEYLKNLIAACHRNAILVYAWLELPHVSEKFWAAHPEWREKTAVGQDAQLDWRKLMNLQNSDCRRAVSKEVLGLLRRFDWDGVNVAELYYESLEGVSNPARFTPMNAEIREEFKHIGGFDPKLLFDPDSPHAAAKDPDGLRTFLDFRAHLTSRMQTDWLDVVEQARATKPYLDVVLTHIDDRFEPGIRDALGADIARTLPLIAARRSTLLVEDPATMWNLGADRYAKLAEQYRQLTKRQDQLAVDINIVDRYQEVYPTKKQTGTELFQLVHQASASFQHVALYFESSLAKQDLGILAAAASTAKIKTTEVDELEVEAAQPTRVEWQGAAEMDGKPWPIRNAQSVLMPAGKHRLRAGIGDTTLGISDFNGEVRSALASKNRVDLSYASRGRAIALFGKAVRTVDVDGETYWEQDRSDEKTSVVLPAGQHVVSFNR